MRTRIAALGVVLWLIAGVSSVSPVSAQEERPGVDVGAELALVCEDYEVPGLVALGIKEGQIWGAGAAGVRQSGGLAAVTLDDRFHIGSCTKAMTATLAAILVEDGLIRWDSTIAEVLPEVAEAGREEYASVTLAQLLRHTSGLPDDRKPDPDLWPMIRAADGPMRERRVLVSKLSLRQKPVCVPGEGKNYSNLGYTVAGTMLERVADATYEDLMRERLFEPLGMESAGFGPPGHPGELDEPVGHVQVTGGRLRGIPPTPRADNPAVIAPAGTVHCCVGDWGKFALLHLRGATGEEGLLISPESFEMLHPEMRRGGRLGMGWIPMARPWAGGGALTHDGSNGSWYALIWVAPKANSAYLAATNCGGRMGVQACNEALGKMIFWEETASGGADD